MTKVMVVDDAAFMRMILKDMLASEGFEIVAEAANGEQAVHLFKQFKPDLVMMDITMPKMDGVAAMKEIQDWDPHARIVMCSAMGQYDLVVNALKSGAKDFIAKPPQKDRVLAAVKKALL